MPQQSSCYPELVDVFCEQETNFVAARDAIVEAVEKNELPVQALDGASSRIDQVLKLAGEYDSFDQTELRAPLGNDRRSSNSPKYPDG